ncbi:homing endonuclease-like protein, partial [Thermoplasmatales archaeon SCGC AB-539-N05]
MQRKHRKFILVVFSVCFISISSFFPVISFNVDGAADLSSVDGVVDEPQFADQAAILSCFMPGTPINMANRSYKNIENVKIGDWVKVFSPKTGEIEAAQVNQIARPWKDNMHKIYLENGKILQASANHPFMTKNKGWTAIDGSDITNINARKLEIGDYLYSVNSDDEIEEVKVIDIVPIEGMYRAYDLVDMKYYTYIADDILVHNSELVAVCFVAGTKISMAAGTTKNIEDIQVGDKALSFDIRQDKVVTSTVTEAFDLLNENGVYNINKGFLRCTGDHPLFVYKPDGTEGWAAVDPALSESSYFKGIIQLEVGDRLFTRKNNGETTSTIVHSIVYEPACVQVYSLSVNHEAHNFFANGVMAHNALSCGPPYEYREYIVVDKIVITTIPDPPIENAYVTIITTPSAESINVQIVDSEISVVGEALAANPPQYFIPDGCAGKWLYVIACDFTTGARGEVHKQIIEQNINIPPNAFIDSISPNP